LKYIPLPFDDPKSYYRLGLTVRERFELNDAPLFGIASNKATVYLLDRLQWHVDVRRMRTGRFFVGVRGRRAQAKDVLTPCRTRNRWILAWLHTYVDSFWAAR